MPYIKQEDRFKMDKVIQTMINEEVKPDGKLNYVLFKFCKETVKPSYNNYKNFIAELNECAEEIRRRMLVNYENDKIIENGDV